MSPGSQGTLEVERYIGSCLISSNVRNGTHKAIIGKKQDQNNLRLKNNTKVCYSGGQNYGNNGGEQCSMQYGTVSGGWAGAPLISMTSSPRRCNQGLSTSVGQQQQHQLQAQQQQSQACEQQQQQQQQQQPQQQQQQQQQLNGHLHKSPLSRLAIHTQGAPLILAGRFHNRGKIHVGNGSVGLGNGVPSNGSNNLAVGGYVHVNGNSSANTMNSTMNGSISGPTRCPAPQRPRRPMDSTKKIQTSNGKGDCSNVSKDSTGTNIANIDSLSIASDESSGSNNSENSLPRIIKPRKRRKKDRKPPNGGITPSSMDANSTTTTTTTTMTATMTTTTTTTMMTTTTTTTTTTTMVTKSEELQQQQQHQQQRTSPNGAVNEQSNLVSMLLKPYVSASCYDQQRYESGSVQQRNHRRPPIGRESVYGSCRTQVSSVQAIADIRQQRYAHRHVQVKVLDDNRNVVVPGTMRAIQSKAYRPHSHYHHHHHHHHHVVSNNNNNNNNNNNTNNNNNNNNNNVVSRYVHQEYNDAPANCEDGFTDGLGLCQCRYCNPSGLIWDVDQNGYSPYLTAPTCNDFCPSNQYPPPQQPTPTIFLSRGSSLGCQDRHQHQHHQHHHHHHHHRHHQQQQQQQQQQQATIERLFDAECPGLTRPERDAASSTAVILRRSWSDPTSYFSEEITAPSRDVGVIGDRGQSENGKRCGGTFWHGDTASSGMANGTANNVSSSNSNLGNSASSPTSKGLEVSTEIVTSPNGHRDLEIKFYSPSPNAQTTTIEEDKSIFVEEDEEDFNDIWSYHESKLQQDFRSLLQAEE